MKLSAIYTDGMILQRNKTIRIYGEAAAGGKITVSMESKTGEAVADANGKFQVSLPAFEAGGPFTMDIVEEAGDSLSLKDIYVGDVFLLSGQSNMEFFLRYDENSKITSILLSRKSGYLKSFAKKSGPKVEEKDYIAVDTLLQQRFGEENTIRNMRHEKITTVDEAGTYVWQKSDNFIQDWFRENSYRLNDTELFDELGMELVEHDRAFAAVVRLFVVGAERTVDRLDRRERRFDALAAFVIALEVVGERVDFAGGLAEPDLGADGETAQALDFARKLDAEFGIILLEGVRGGGIGNDKRLYSRFLEECRELLRSGLRLGQISEHLERLADTSAGDFNTSCVGNYRRSRSRARPL